MSQESHTIHRHEHPRLLTDFVWRPTKETRATLMRDCGVRLSKGFKGRHEFTDEKGFTFAILQDDNLVMLQGLASDLCSPAIRIAGRWVGTPSGEKEALAAYVHDTTRRIMRAGCVPGMTRKVTDDLFYDFLMEARSRWTRLFHRAVASPVGSLWMAFSTEIVVCRQHDHARIP
jgi:hypothetical protein